VNSYKRLVPGYEAPVYTAWSPANRSALLRVPAKRGKSTRIELRSPDPSTNPYLAFATLLQAGIDGIENKIEPPKPAEVNIYNLSEEERAARKIEPLPGSLYEALAELKTSPIAKKALGDHIYNEFIATKEREWKSFSVNVSPWELETYMRMH
ncbi:MAG: type I glutamate--ammonia ligase, partial [Cyanobacteria bacterium HKST-UBA05]|nr:type I glutamate--ammonia ligase [Cyanobacteria bacterium HKST-UBA05]